MTSTSIRCGQRTKDFLRGNRSPHHSRCSRSAQWLMAKNGLIGPRPSLLITQVGLLITSPKALLLMEIK